MNTALLIPRTFRQVILQALAMVAIVAISVFFLFRYYHIRTSLWFWAAIIPFNFGLFVATLSFTRWLRRKRDEWSSTTNRWFSALMFLLAVALFIAALYIRALQ